LKIANVHVGTIHQNVRIALQFSYWFAIFISVSNFHISLQFSLFGVWFLPGRLQFSYGFVTFISVCNSLPCNYELELITPCQQRLNWLLV
jgi:hypothetical protein